MVTVLLIDNGSEECCEVDPDVLAVGGCIDVTLVRVDQETGTSNIVRVLSGLNGLHLAHFLLSTENIFSLSFYSYNSYLKIPRKSSDGIY